MADAWLVFGVLYAVLWSVQGIQVSSFSVEEQIGFSDRPWSCSFFPTTGHRQVNWNSFENQFFL